MFLKFTFFFLKTVLYLSEIQKVQLIVCKAFTPILLPYTTEEDLAIIMLSESHKPAGLWDSFHVITAGCVGMGNDYPVCSKMESVSDAMSSLIHLQQSISFLLTSDPFPVDWF